MPVEQERSLEIVIRKDLPVIDANPEIPTFQFKKELRKAFEDMKRWRSPGFKLANLFDPTCASIAATALNRSNFGFEYIFANLFNQVFKPKQYSLRDSFPNQMHQGYEDEGLHFDESGWVNSDMFILRLHMMIEGQALGYFTNTTSMQFEERIRKLNIDRSRKLNKKFTIDKNQSVRKTILHNFSENPGEGVVFISQGIVGEQLVIPSAQHNFISATRQRRFGIRDITLFF